MADPAELERQLSQLRKATKLKDSALERLTQAQETQDQRWARLRRVIYDAGNQYVSMRIDSVEERLRDQGTPLWLSCVVIIGVTMVPISAITTSFVGSLMRSTQRLLTARQGLALERTEWFLQLGHKTHTISMAARELPEQIKRTEMAVANFVKMYDPELAKGFRDAAKAVGERIGKPAFEQQSGQMQLSQKSDAALVVVTRWFLDWIDRQGSAETTARRLTREQIYDLFEIATSTDPADTAKHLAIEIAERQAAREPIVSLGKQPGTIQHIPQPAPDKLPKTNAAAIKQLKELHERLGLDLSENTRVPDTQDLRDLQLIIESAIWAATYDFAPVMRRVNMNRDDPKVVPYWIDEYKPAPLPSGLWKRLTGRYIDPDEGKTYKETGTKDWLGTKENPLKHGKDKFTPEVRLSHYFSYVLFPQITKQNSEMVQLFRTI